MRDVRRIRPFLDNVAAVWEQCPDLRFGQFIMDVVPDNNRLWNCEEAGFLSALKQFEEGHDFARTDGIAADTGRINNLFVYGIEKGKYQFNLYRMLMISSIISNLETKRSYLMVHMSLGHWLKTY